MLLDLAPRHYECTRHEERTLVFSLLTPLQLETHFWGQNYLDLVWGGVRGLYRDQACDAPGIFKQTATPRGSLCMYVETCIRDGIRPLMLLRCTKKTSLQRLIMKFQLALRGVNTSTTGIHHHARLFCTKHEETLLLPRGRRRRHRRFR